MSTNWRSIAMRIVYETLERLPEGATFKEKRAALREAYPFGERAHQPYKVWLSECRRQLKLPARPKPSDKRNQMVLFD